MPVRNFAKKATVSPEFTATKKIVDDVNAKIKDAKEAAMKEQKLSVEMATETSKADAERFECPVCLNIIEGLKICKTCQKQFCARCIDVWEDDRCPCCNSTFKALKQDRFQKETLNNL